MTFGIREENVTGYTNNREHGRVYVRRASTMTTCCSIIILYNNVCTSIAPGVHIRSIQIIVLNTLSSPEYRTNKFQD